MKDRIEALVGTLTEDIFKEDVVVDGVDDTNTGAFVAVDVLEQVVTIAELYGSALAVMTEQARMIEKLEARTSWFKKDSDLLTGKLLRSARDHEREMLRVRPDKITGVEHELKVWPAFFEELFNGRKGYEVRRYDRDYNVGDVLWLREWDPTVVDARFPNEETQKEPDPRYTGRQMRAAVNSATMLLSNPPGMKAGDLDFGQSVIVLGLCEAP